MKYKISHKNPIRGNSNPTALDAFPALFMIGAAAPIVVFTQETNDASVPLGKGSSVVVLVKEAFDLEVSLYPSKESARLEAR